MTKAIGSIQSLLEELQQDDLDRLEVEVMRIKQTLYPKMPAIITRTAALTGISEEILVRACCRASQQYAKLEWYQILDIIRSFWLAKNQIEEQQKADNTDSLEKPKERQ